MTDLMLYYELGYAHDAGNIAKNPADRTQRVTTLHFDIASLRIEPYSDIVALRSVLATKLQLLLGERELVPRAKSHQPRNVHLSYSAFSVPLET